MRAGLRISPHFAACWQRTSAQLWRGGWKRYPSMTLLLPVFMCTTPRRRWPWTRCRPGPPFLSTGLPSASSRSSRGHPHERTTAHLEIRMLWLEVAKVTGTRSVLRPVGMMVAPVTHVKPSSTSRTSGDSRRRRVGFRRHDLRRTPTHLRNRTRASAAAIELGVTTRAATVFAGQISIVAIFTRIDGAVARTGRHARRRAGVIAVAPVRLSPSPSPLPTPPTSRRVGSSEPAKKKKKPRSASTSHSALVARDPRHTSVDREDGSCASVAELGPSRVTKGGNFVERGQARRAGHGSQVAGQLRDPWPELAERTPRGRHRSRSRLQDARRGQARAAEALRMKSC